MLKNDKNGRKKLNRPYFEKKSKFRHGHSKLLEALLIALRTWIFDPLSFAVQNRSSRDWIPEIDFWLWSNFRSLISLSKIPISEIFKYALKTWECSLDFHNDGFWEKLFFRVEKNFKKKNVVFWENFKNGIIRKVEFQSQIWFH